MSNLLDEIAEKIEEEKGWEGKVSFFQVIHYIPTEFISYEKKLFIFSYNVLWIDIDNLEGKIITFFTRDKRIAETVKRVANLHGITCKETIRDHFPPSMSF